MSVVATYFDQKEQQFSKEFAEFLSFASVSTDPAFCSQCLACVEWLKQHLTLMGFSVELIETPGKPCLLASYVGEPNLPTILYYGHYDVQPADPLDQWDSEPFVATERLVGGERRIFARGAQDNKGQTFYVLKALEYLLQRGQLKNSVKLLIEGEEECGSNGLAQVMTALAPKLKADVLLVCDTGVLALEVPMITVGLRGTAGFEVTICGAAKDLHSGVHGGVVKNPAFELVRLLGLLKDPGGSVRVPGFYDNILELSETELQHVRAFPLSEEAYFEMIGMPPSGGEAGLTLGERRGVRPALDIVGMYSGYTGPGLKSVIPAEASAKLSMRLVPDQDPQQVIEALKAYLTKNLDGDFRIKFAYDKGIGGALRADCESAALRRATAVLKEVVGTDPILCWEGASIPIVGSLSQAAGAEPVLVGFGLEADNIHAPNESFSWRQLKLGFSFVVNFLERMAAGSSDC